MELLYFGPENQNSSGEPALTVFLHGFPGVRSKQNRVFAEEFSRKTGRRSLVVLYDGLGFSAGEFSFSKCLSQVEELFESLLATTKGKIDIVGHSWGGFLALKMAARCGDRIRRIILLSPLLKFFPVDVCSPSFANTAQENPQLRLGDTSKLAEDFAGVGEATPTESLVEAVPDGVEIVFLQSTTDEITPLNIAESALPFFRKKPRFERVETDHSFLVDRSKIVERVTELLACYFLTL